MKRAATILLLLACATARADDPVPVPLLAGEPAPYDGVLLSERRLEVLLQADLRTAEAVARVEAQGKALATLEDQLAKEKQRQAGGGGFWWGVALGAAAVVGLALAVK